jgi:hypothetical protein
MFVTTSSSGAEESKCPVFATLPKAAVHDDTTAAYLAGLAECLVGGACGGRVCRAVQSLARVRVAIAALLSVAGVARARERANSVGALLLAASVVGCALVNICRRNWMGCHG